MGILKYILFIVAFLSSCSINGQKLTTEKLGNAYQTFPYKGGIICLMIYDQWGENNAIIQYDNKLNMIAKNSFRIDPIPRIISKNAGTIILRYIFTKDSSLHQNVVNHNQEYLSALGNLKIEYSYKYILNGNSIGDTIFYDHIALDNRTYMVSFSKDRNVVKKLYLKDIYSYDDKLWFIEIKNGLEVSHYLSSMQQKEEVRNLYSKIIGLFK